jgi:hypothetical protein
MANGAVEVSEEELEQAFRTSPLTGLQFLESHFRKNIFAYIKSLCPHFGSSDLLEVYQDTMRRLVRKAKQADFTPDRPMRLVQDVARKAAIDAKRKKKLPTIGDARDIAELLGGDLKDTRVAMEWRLVLKEDMPRVQQAIDEAIENLPAKQKLTAIAMMHVYEEIHDTRSFLPLKLKIRDLSGEDLTTTQAYDNWRQARKAIAAKLQRAGFNLYDEN